MKLKPLYRESFGNSESTLQRKREERRKERFAWRVGYYVMAGISVLGSYVIWWAWNL